MNRRLALGLWGGMDPDRLLAVVAQAEKSGYESVFVIESYADVFAFLAAAARETSSIGLGTGVATIFTRSPTVLALAAITIDGLSHGRFQLGLGIGHSEIHQSRDDVEKERPLAFRETLQRLKEVTEIVRLIVRGAWEQDTVDYEGQIFRIAGFRPRTPAVRQHLPIHFGALSSRTMELAGQVADGIMPIFLPLSEVSHARAAVERGADKMGRSSEGMEIACYLPCCVSGDFGTARDAVRMDMATHIMTRAFYRSHFRRHGFGDVVERVIAKSIASDVEAAARQIPDDLLDSTCIFGSPERCLDQIGRYEEAGVTLPIIYPIHAEFRSYLPDSQAQAGLLHTVTSLGKA